MAISVMTISVITVCAVMADRVQRAEEDDGEEDRRDRAPHDADPWGGMRAPVSAAHPTNPHAGELAADSSPRQHAAIADAVVANTQPSLPRRRTVAIVDASTGIAADAVVADAANTRIDDAVFADSYMRSRGRKGCRH
jgi:hypothetical protein